MPISWYTEKGDSGNVLEESGVKAERSDADATVLDANTEDVKYESVNSDNSACKYEMPMLSVKQEVVAESVVSTHYDPVTDVFDELPKLEPASPCVSVPLKDDANQDSVDTEHQESPPASPCVSVSPCVNIPLKDDANQDLVDTEHQESPPASPCVSVSPRVNVPLKDDSNQDLVDTEHQESPPASPCVSVAQDDDANWDMDLGDTDLGDTDNDSPSGSPSATLGSNDSVVSDNNDVQPDKVDTEHQESPPASPCVNVAQDDDANQDMDLGDTDLGDTDNDSPSATLDSNDSVVSDNNDTQPDKVDTEHEDSLSGSSSKSYIEELNPYSIKQCKVVLEQLDLEFLETNVMQTVKSSVQVKKCSVVLNWLHPCDVKKYRQEHKCVANCIKKGYNNQEANEN